MRKFMYTSAMKTTSMSARVKSRSIRVNGGLRRDSKETMKGTAMTVKMQISNMTACIPDKLDMQDHLEL